MCVNITLTPSRKVNVSHGERKKHGILRLRSFLVLLFVPIILLMAIAVGLLIEVNISISNHSTNLTRESVQKILYAQRSFVNLESLRNSLRTLATMPGLSDARSAYIDAFALLSESAIDRHESMKEPTKDLLKKIRNVWLERQKIETDRDDVYLEWKAFHGFGLMTYMLATGAGEFPDVMRGNERLDLVEAKHEVLEELAGRIYRELSAPCGQRPLKGELVNACTRFAESYDRLCRQLAKLKTASDTYRSRLNEMDESTTQLAKSFIVIETEDILHDVNIINKLAERLLPVVGTFMLATLLICAVLFLGFLVLLRPLNAISGAIQRFQATLKVPELSVHSPIVEINQISSWLKVLFERFVTEQAKSKKLFSSYRTLLWTSSHDALTGLANRQALRDFISTTPVTPASLGLLMVDIDHFKEINDTKGHPFGDKVLSEVAKALKSAVAESDEVFRYGGEEFCVICPDVTQKNLARIADRLLMVVRSISRETAERVTEGEADMPVTVSIGCAAVSAKAGSRSIREMISEADRALYRAKQHGRNRAESALAFEDVQRDALK